MTEPTRPPPGADLGVIDDPSIPVLTERIYLPAVELDTALPASLLPPKSPDAEAEDQASPPQAAAELAPSHVTAAPPEQPGSAVEVLGAAAIIAAAAADELAQRPEAADAVAEPAEPATAIEAAPPGGSEQPLPIEHPASEPPPAVDLAADAAEPAIGQPEQAGHAPPSEVVPAAAVDAEALQAALEERADALRAAVLQRVSERLPEQVTAAVRDLMQPAIDQAMARLGEEAQVALRITLQDLIEQALREELARKPDVGPPR
jgi:hypothetical protein